MRSSVEDIGSEVTRVTRERGGDVGRSDQRTAYELVLGFWYVSLRPLKSHMPSKSVFHLSSQHSDGSVPQPQ